MNMKRLRGICALIAVVALPVIGLLMHTGTGTLSSFGFDTLSVVCPLGALEAMLGSGSVTHALFCLLLTVVLVLILGKVFCSWVCPFPWLQRFFKGKKGASATKASGESATKASKEAESHERHPHEGHAQGGCSACSACRKPLPPVGGKRDGIRLDSRHMVLAGALGSAAIFGFPVFCLVCPIGLTFTVLIGLWHLFAFNETTWGLVVFPLILLLEVTLLRKWCFRICPISALLSLISSGNRLFRPSVDAELCLREQGTDCRACVNVCPEKLDPHSAAIPECSKCGLCVEVCPEKAITFPPVRGHLSSTPCTTRMPKE